MFLLYVDIGGGGGGDLAFRVSLLLFRLVSVFSPFHLFGCIDGGPFQALVIRPDLGRLMLQYGAGKPAGGPIGQGHAAGPTSLLVLLLTLFPQAPPRAQPRVAWIPLTM